MIKIRTWQPLPQRCIIKSNIEDTLDALMLLVDNYEEKVNLVIDKQNEQIKFHNNHFADKPEYQKTFIEHIDVDLMDILHMITIYDTQLDDLIKGMSKYGSSERQSVR